MLRMERLSWRALRPVLIAGAAATAWLALSAPTASADAASDTGSLLGGVTSSVTSVSEAATRPVEDVLAAAAFGPGAGPADAALPSPPDSAEPAVTLQPLTATADQFISAVPVVNLVVPSGTVATVTETTFDTTDVIVADLAQELLPAASGIISVLDPVVEPVSDRLAGVEALPGNVAASDRAVTASGVVGGTTDTPVLAPSLPVGAESAVRAPAADVPSYSTAPLGTAGSGVLQLVPVSTGSVESPGHNEGSPGQSEVPAVPCSGSGSSQSSGGGAGGAAWLSTFHVDVALIGVFPISGPLQNAPAPVSFDPGSSPD